MLWWRAVCWAVREAARSVGEELMCFSMGAKGDSRAVGMREGAAILVALVYERVASGGWQKCALLLFGWCEEGCGWVRTFQPVSHIRLPRSLAAGPARQSRLPAKEGRRTRAARAGSSTGTAVEQPPPHMHTYFLWRRSAAGSPPRANRCGNESSMATAHSLCN